MDTGKVYQDSAGNDCSIVQMVSREPYWAANRVQEGEKAIEQLADLQQKNLELARHNMELRDRMTDLERELADLQVQRSQELTELREEADKWHSEVEVSRVRIAELERERDRAIQQHERCAEKLFNAERKLAEARKDAERYRWLCADLFGEERIKRNGILCRMPVMSYSAASTDIDAAMRQEGE